MFEIGEGRSLRPAGNKRKTKPVRRAWFFTFAAFFATPALAADEDSQAWVAANATIGVSKDIVVWLEGQARFTDNVGNLGQVLIRPGLGLKLGPNTTAYVGYAYVHTDPPGPAKSNEHRAWQQLSFRIAGNGKGLTVTGRSRLEQRWVEGANDMGWRYRQQLRLTAPIGGKVRGVAWSEAFVALDDTSWGQRSGIDRWRNFVGIAVPASKAVTIEPGYLNQYVVRQGAADRIHHVASITLSAKF